jgi:hypothetical protein
VNVSWYARLPCTNKERSKIENTANKKISLETKRRKETMQNSYKQCCGSGMFIPDPGSEFFHPGSLVKDPESGSASKKINIFNPKNC